MSNPGIERYIEENIEKYPINEIRQQLLRQGFGVTEINEAIANVERIRLERKTQNFGHKIGVSILIISLIIITGIAGFLLYEYIKVPSCGDGVCGTVEKQDGTCSKDCENKTVNYSGVVSEVRIINGVPKIFVNGKELQSAAFTQVYYHPDASLGPDEARYSEARWVTRLKGIIDTASADGVKIVILNIWWSDLDTSLSRPANIADSLNFEPLDKVMNYASEKGVYMMLFPVLHHNVPQWWKTENNFPNTWYNRSDIAENKRCDCCETDSMGTSYANPGDGCELIHQDYGNYLKALIYRYKNHTALLGWSFGIGPTAEDNYGPSYVLMRETGDHTAEKIKNDSDRMTDFSPSFTKLFGAWLLEKYTNDNGLQKAWGSNSVSFANFSTPDIKQLFTGNANSRLFDCASSQFTSKGKDFCNFREVLRTKERDFYINLFATNDPNHILVLNGIDNQPDLLKEKKEISGVTWNPTYAYYEVTWGQNEQFYEQIKKVQTVVSAGKLPFVAAETLHYPGAETERLTYLEQLGKAIICAGGIAGYASDLFGDQNIIRTTPTWYTLGEMAVVKKISSYSKTSSCGCDTIKEVYTANNCVGHVYKKGEGKCSLLDKAYSQFCVNSHGNNLCDDGICDGLETSANCPSDCGAQPDTNGTTQGRCNDGVCDGPETNTNCPTDCGVQPNTNGTTPCGDGICDDFESQNNACPEDCGLRI